MDAAQPDPRAVGPWCLSVADLISKWGFGDGDMFFDWLFDQQLDTDDDHVLIEELVRRHLVPLLPQPVEIDTVWCSHNSTRATRIGRFDDLQRLWYETDPPDPEIDISVEVTEEQVRAAFDALVAEGRMVVKPWPSPASG